MERWLSVWKLQVRPRSSKSTTQSFGVEEQVPIDWQVMPSFEFPEPWIRDSTQQDCSERRHQGHQRSPPNFRRTGRCQKTNVHMRLSKDFHRGHSQHGLEDLQQQSAANLKQKLFAMAPHLEQPPQQKLHQKLGDNTLISIFWIVACSATLAETLWHPNSHQSPRGCGYANGRWSHHFVSGLQSNSLNVLCHFGSWASGSPHSLSANVRPTLPNCHDCSAVL